MTLLRMSQPPGFSSCPQTPTHLPVCFRSTAFGFQGTAIQIRKFCWQNSYKESWSTWILLPLLHRTGKLESPVAVPSTLWWAGFYDCFERTLERSLDKITLCSFKDSIILLICQWLLVPCTKTAWELTFTINSNTFRVPSPLGDTFLAMFMQVFSQVTEERKTHLKWVRPLHGLKAQTEGKRSKELANRAPECTSPAFLIWSSVSTQPHVPTAVPSLPDGLYVLSHSEIKRNP